MNSSVTPYTLRKNLFAYFFLPFMLLCCFSFCCFFRIKKIEIKAACFTYKQKFLEHLKKVVIDDTTTAKFAEYININKNMFSIVPSNINFRPTILKDYLVYTKQIKGTK